jgi:hypothetical protein
LIPVLSANNEMTWMLDWKWDIAEAVNEAYLSHLKRQFATDEYTPVVNYHVAYVLFLSFLMRFFVFFFFDFARFDHSLEIQRENAYSAWFGPGKIETK